MTLTPRSSYQLNWLVNAYILFDEILKFLQEVKGYKVNRCKLFVSYFLYLITVGFLRLVFYWLPHRMLQFTHDACALERAEKVMLKVGLS